MRVGWDMLPVVRGSSYCSKTWGATAMTVGLPDPVRLTAAASASTPVSLVSASIAPLSLGIG